jgi:hypothetical protein
VLVVASWPAGTANAEAAAAAAYASLRVDE